MNFEIILNCRKVRSDFKLLLVMKSGKIESQWFEC